MKTAAQRMISRRDLIATGRRTRYREAAAAARRVCALYDAVDDADGAERWVAEGAGWQLILHPGWTIHMPRRTRGRSSRPDSGRSGSWGRRAAWQRGTCGARQQPR